MGGGWWQGRVGSWGGVRGGVVMDLKIPTRCMAGD